MSPRKPPRWVSSFPPHDLQQETWVPLDNASLGFFRRESPFWDVVILLILVAACLVAVSPLFGMWSWLYL